MKRSIILAVGFILGCSFMAQAQRATGQVVAGATSSAATPVNAAILVDSDGTVHTTGVTTGTVTVVQPTMSSGVSVALGALSGSTNVALIAQPCQTSPGVTVSGSISTSTTIVTGTAAKLITICDFSIYVNGTATSWAMVEGTGTLCATNLAANYLGGTTASAGPNFIANQGLIAIKSDGLYVSTRAADNLCLLLSAANQVNYNLRYVVQ